MCWRGRFATDWDVISTSSWSVKRGRFSGKRPQVAIRSKNRRNSSWKMITMASRMTAKNPGAPLPRGKSWNERPGSR